jgi:hypothetical protein
VNGFETIVVDGSLHNNPADCGGILVLVGVARRRVTSGIVHIVPTIGIAVIGPLVHHHLATSLVNSAIPDLGRMEIWRWNMHVPVDSCRAKVL